MMQYWSIFKNIKRDYHYRKYYMLIDEKIQNWYWHNCPFVSIICRIRYQKKGRKRFIPFSDIKKIQDSIVTAGVKGLNLNDARNLVQKFADEHNIKNDKLPSYDGGKEASTSCVWIYQRELVQHPHLGIAKVVSSKTTICEAYENSLRSTATYLFTIAESHFIKQKFQKIIQPKLDMALMGWRKW